MSWLKKNCELFSKEQDSFRYNPVLNAQYKKVQSEYSKWRILDIERQGL